MHRSQFYIEHNCRWACQLKTSEHRFPQAVFSVKVVSPLIFLLLFKDVLTLLIYFFLCTWFQLATFQNTRSDFKVHSLFAPKHTQSQTKGIYTHACTSDVLYQTTKCTCLKCLANIKTHTHTPGLSYDKFFLRGKKDDPE